MYTAKSLLKANYLNSADSATAETLRPLTPGPDSSQQQKTTSQRVNGHTASFSSFAQCAQVDTGQQGPEDAAALVQSSSPVSAAATAGQHLPTGQARLSYDVLVPDSASECSTPRRGKDRSGISQVLTASDRLYAAAPGSPADIAATLAVRPSQVRPAHTPLRRYAKASMTFLMELSSLSDPQPAQAWIQSAQAHVMTSTASNWLRCLAADI